MPDPLGRELSISYGATTIGGPSGHYLLDGTHRITRSWNHASVEFECTVVGTSEPDFASRVQALESAFSDPDHSLIVAQGAQVLLAFAAAPKDWCRPTIVKRGEITDNGRSRTYTLRVDVDPAATQLSPSGLREATVDVAYSPARRRTVTLSGLWTATDGDGSRDAYESAIEAYATARLDELGGTYELAEEPVTARDRPDHALSFRRVYVELLWQQGGSSSADDPDIVRQSAVFRRRRVAPGDSVAAVGSGTFEGFGGDTESQPAAPVVQRPTVIDVNYSAWIDKDVSDLKGKWDTILPWLVGVVQSDFGLGALALTEEAPAFDYDENRISATLTVTGLEGGNTLEQTITVQTTAQQDEVLVPAWSGKPYAAYAYDGPRVLTRTVSLRALVLDEPPVDEQAARARVRRYWTGGTDGIADAGGGGWTRGVIQTSVTRRKMGMQGHTMDVAEIVGSWTRRYYQKPEGGSGTTTSSRPTPRPATTQS